MGRERKLASIVGFGGRRGMQFCLDFSPRVTARRNQRTAAGQNGGEEEKLGTAGVIFVTLDFYFFLLLQLSGLVFYSLSK